MPLFGAAFAAPNKGTTVLFWFRSLSTVLIPTENKRIQGLFKAFAWFSSTFQGIFNFQVLFKKALYIQVLFKPVQTLSLFHWLNKSASFKPCRIRSCSYEFSAQWLRSISYGWKYSELHHSCLVNHKWEVCKQFRPWQYKNSPPSWAEFNLSN